MERPQVPKATTQTSKEVGLAEGFRSGLEEVVSQQIISAGFEPDYETFKIEYVKPARTAKYTPDFPIGIRLGNSIIIETKGRFITEDRQKHLLVKAQRPDLDIRFVFSNSKQRIRKGSPTTYADWCIKNGFKFADKRIPKAWFDELRQA